MDETNLLLDEHPKMFRANPLLFILAVITIPVLIGIIILIGMWLRSIGERIAISEHAMLVEKGILNKNSTEVSLTSVRTVRIDQTFLDRIFNVGRIDVYTAGDSPEATISGISEPNRVRDMVRARQNFAQQAS